MNWSSFKDPLTAEIAVSCLLGASIKLYTLFTLLQNAFYHEFMFLCYWFICYPPHPTVCSLSPTAPCSKWSWSLSQDIWNTRTFNCPPPLHQIAKSCHRMFWSFSYFLLTPSPFSVLSFFLCCPVLFTENSLRSPPSPVSPHVPSLSPLISLLLCRMLLNIFYICPLLFFTSHFIWAPCFSLSSVSLWSAHRML